MALTPTEMELIKKKLEKTITKNDKIKIHLAPGGGWAVRIHK
jgi:hypothetical protein